MGNSEWNSLLAYQLLNDTNTSSIEDALIVSMDRKLNTLSHLKYPLDLEFIASIFGIDPNFRYVEMQQAGRLVPLEGKWYIEVNKHHQRVRQRFSIAHEIGHKAVMTSKHRIPKERMAYNPTHEKDEEEEMCDLFASFLLGLRPQHIISILDDRGFSLTTIDYLTSQLNVSFETATRALVRHAEIPVAILYCLPTLIANTERFYVQRYYPAAQFPLTFKGKSILPPFNCLTRAWLGNKAAKMLELWQIGRQDTYTCLLEAKRMPIYASETREDGLVVAVIIQE